MHVQPLTVYYDKQLIFALVFVLVDVETSFAHLWCDQDISLHYLTRLDERERYGLDQQIVTFFSSTWSRRLLDSVDKSLHNKRWAERHPSMDDDSRGGLGALCWLLSTASLNLTLNLISLSVYEIAFKAIEHPGMKVLSEIASCRRNLHQLRNEMEMREQTTSSAIKRWALNAHEEFARDFQRSEYYMPSFLGKSCVGQWASCVQK